ncbi:MAG: hypothetical protein PHQ78_08835 [Candidatus Cloacimonetes bacterium]|nr:hypothetical protein [Candidatus Cloacimonadota bacterium]
MKLYVFLIVGVALLISACSTTRTVTLPYEQSAAMAIDKAVKNINLPTKLSGYLSPLDHITLVSIEDPGTTDNDVTATVEDAIINQFVSAGYKILERDNDMIYKNLIDSGKLNGSNITVTASEGSESIINLTKTGGFEITPATKVVSYRINEIGVLYGPDKDEYRSSSNIERNAQVIMNVRVETPANNQIIHGNTYEGTFQDYVPRQTARYLENMHYRFHASNYPKTNPKRISDDILPQITTTAARPKKGTALLAVLGSITILALVASSQK